MKLSEYIEVEKITKDDVLIFKININMFDDRTVAENMSETIRDVKELLGEKEIKAIFIPYYNGFEFEINRSTSELLELYDRQQETIGFRNGFIKGLSDFNNSVEYNDVSDSKSVEYIEFYKNGYKKGFEIRTLKV
jgi:hypothetical protein